MARALIVSRHDQGDLCIQDHGPASVRRVSRHVRCCLAGSPCRPRVDVNRHQVAEVPGGHTVSHPVVSGALCRRPKALRLSLTLDILHLVLIRKLRLKPPRIARGAEETIPVKTFYNLFGYKPGLGVPRARE